VEIFQNTLHTYIHTYTHIHTNTHTEGERDIQIYVLIYRTHVPCMYTKYVRQVSWPVDRFRCIPSLFNVADIGDVTDFWNVCVFLYRQIIVFNKYRASIISWLTVHLPPSTLNDKAVIMKYACRRRNAVRFGSLFFFFFFKHLHTLVEGTG